MGILSRIIGYPLGWIMWLAYTICNNYALSIVIFTLITKILLFPLSVKTQKNSAAMAAFSPKLEQLKKKYGNNQQKLQEATMELYAEENINPMSSCLPMFIQFPILYGIFDVVYRPITHILRASSDAVAKATEICKNIAGYGDQSAFSNRPELYIMQAIADPNVTDQFMSLPEGLYDQLKDFDTTLFGFIDLNLTPSFHPEGGWTAGAVGLVVIAFMSGITQLIMTLYSNARQKKLNPEAAKQMGSMNIMLYTMPIFSIWVAFSFPAGVGFYWGINAIFSFLSNIILNKIYTPEYVAELIEKDKKKKKNKKKSDMLQRYKQLMEEQYGSSSQSGSKPEGAVKGALTDNDEDITDIKLSKSQQKNMESRIISEKRKKFEEKYKDSELTEEENKLLEEARRRQAEKYGDN